MILWIALLSVPALAYSRPPSGLSPQKLPKDSPPIDLYQRYPKVTIIPFYGGGKGQSLQIVEQSDGTVDTFIIKTPHLRPTLEESINTAELENPPLPSKHDREFGNELKHIHNKALEVIKLQGIAEQSGQLTPEQKAIYQKNMEELNSSAKNLAELHVGDDEFSFENREGLSAWFERKKNTQKDKDKNEEDKDEKKEEKPKDPEESDSVAIGLPPADASVAEAKPVGLAVAGEGGVAASKPIATAVVGPGGLAIARPVGTAIAGVAPGQALVPIYAEGYVLGNKPKRYGSHKKPDRASEYLNKIIHKYHQV